MDTPYEGCIDDGWQCIKLSSPVELWKSPNESYCVYLMLEQGDFLYIKRSDEKYALRLFDEVCGILK